MKSWGQGIEAEYGTSKFVRNLLIFACLEQHDKWAQGTGLKAHGKDPPLMIREVQGK
ncbi:MAG: hypothetical protein JW944_05840 [Deltaproteobacteria bacterium]|nr:hypothetical protein [Deltaproteobacteria bacterium]